MVDLGKIEAYLPQTPPENQTLPEFFNNWGRGEREQKLWPIAAEQVITSEDWPATFWHFGYHKLWLFIHKANKFE